MSLEFVYDSDGHRLCFCFYFGLLNYVGTSFLKDEFSFLYRRQEFVVLLSIYWLKHALNHRHSRRVAFVHFFQFTKPSLRWQIYGVAFICFAQSNMTHRSNNDKSHSKGLSWFLFSRYGVWKAMDTGKSKHKIRVNISLILWIMSRKIQKTRNSICKKQNSFLKPWNRGFREVFQFRFNGLK